MAQIIIPTPLRKFTSNQAKFEVSGQNVQEAITALTEQFPALKTNILAQDGSIRGFVRIYVGDEDIKSLNNGATAVQTDSVISIIPAIAGGVV